MSRVARIQLRRGRFRTFRKLQLLSCLLLVILLGQLFLIKLEFSIRNESKTNFFEGLSRFKLHSNGVTTPDSSVLVVVPGIGDVSRLRILKASLLQLRKTSSADCLVFVWNASAMEQVKEELQFCHVQYNSGMWTDHIKLVTSDHPSINFGRLTHVAILIDDIDVSKVHFTQFLNLMRISGYGMASASFSQWHYHVMHRRSVCTSHRSDYADILFSVFTIPTWLCWLSLLTKDNRIGWGYDLVLSGKCNVTVGVIDEFEAFHDGQCEHGGDCTRSYNETLALSQLWKFIIDSTTATNEDEARTFLVEITANRPKNYMLCDFWNPNFVKTLKESNAMKFRLADDSYFKTVSHRSGWGRVIQYLIDSNHMVTNSEKIDIDRKGGNLTDIFFLDFVEKYFEWDKKETVRMPWVGIMHLAMNLPVHIHQALRLESALQNSNFLASLEHCLALFVLSDDVRTFLTKYLNSNGFGKVAVYTVRHPVTVESSAEKFTLQDLDILIQSSSAGVILLGQQYRRLATIHTLKTTRQKLWLPGTPKGSAEVEMMKNELPSELAIDNSTSTDPSVTMFYTSNFTDYDNLIKHNIVIIDLWGATANNAILEIMALTIPAYVRRLPSTIEYLGEDYPMFFDNKADIEHGLSQDPVLLMNRLKQAHYYLQNIKMEKLTLEYFLHSLQDNTLASFKISHV